MLEKRIEYYAKKVAEYGQTHVSKRWRQYRYERLMQYKQRLDELVKGTRV